MTPKRPTDMWEDWMDEAYLDAEMYALMEARPGALIEDAARFVSSLYGIDYELPIDANDEATVTWRIPA